MRWVRFAILLVIVTIFQATMVGMVDIKTVRPDLLLILLVFFAIYSDVEDAIITSFTIGFAADLIGSAMGPAMISFGIVGTLLAYLHRVIAIRRIPYQMAAIFVVGILTGILVYFLSFLKSQPPATGLYTIIMGRSLYSALIGPILFLPYCWLVKLKAHHFSRP